MGKLTQLQVNNSTFTMNKASHDGGAFHLQNFQSGPVVIGGCQVTSNTAQNNGGAVYYKYIFISVGHV